MSHDEEQEQPKFEYRHHPRRTFDDRKPHIPIRSRPESVTVLLVGLAIWKYF